MTRVGMVPRGAAFWPATAAWIAENFKGGPVRVVVPTARAAAWLGKLLEDRGVKARVIPLRGDAEFGLGVATTISGWKLRGEVGNILKELLPELSAGRQVAMAGELAEVLERLAAYEVSAGKLRDALPEGLAAHWEVNAEVLLKVMARVEVVLRRLGLVLNGTAAVRVFDEAAKGEGGWIAAGVLDALPAARRMVRAIVKGGAVLVPEGGEYTAGLVEVWLKGLGLMDAPREMLAAQVRETAVREVVSAGAWQEVEAVALGVRRAVEEGKKRISVVTPDGHFAARLNGVLARWDLRARVAGGERVAETAAGILWALVLGVVGAPPTDHVAWSALRSAVREDVVKREIWLKLPRRGTLEVWKDAVGGVVDFLAADWRRLDGAAEVAEAFAAAGEISGMVEGEMASAMLGRMLREAVRPAKGSEGIFVMGPQDARLESFDTVIAAQMVEGVWPAPAFNSWLTPAQMRALGMPDSRRRAALAGGEFESLMYGGSGEVMVSHTASSEIGRVVSRFAGGVTMVRDAELEGLALRTDVRREERLGVFVPEGAQYPHVWSASLVETLLACPYKGYAERVLKLLERDPIEPVPDARVGGLLVHAWLKQVGEEFERVTAENAETVRARLLVVADEILREEDAVVRAIWRPKMKTLSSALVERWLHDGRVVELVEKDVRRQVGKVVVRAIVDRVEQGEARTVLDYKTGSVPAWRDVENGRRPQLALEAWLLGEVEGLEYWKLRGFGREPLVVSETQAARMVAPVEEGIARLVDAFGEGAPFPALPDRKGGGLMATGHCEYCALNGVCRRQAEAGG